MNYSVAQETNHPLPYLLHSKNSPFALGPQLEFLSAELKMEILSPYEFICHYKEFKNKSNDSYYEKTIKDIYIKDGAKYTFLNLGVLNVCTKKGTLLLEVQFRDRFVTNRKLIALTEAQAPSKQFYEKFLINLEAPHDE